jgi:hypothetical protein
VPLRHPSSQGDRPSFFSSSLRSNPRNVPAAVSHSFLNLLFGIRLSITLRFFRPIIVVQTQRILFTLSPSPHEKGDVQKMILERAATELLAFQENPKGEHIGAANFSNIHLWQLSKNNSVLRR